MVSKNMFACLDSDDEDMKVVAPKKIVQASAAPVAKKVVAREAHNDNKRGERRNNKERTARNGRNPRHQGNDKKSGTGRGRENAKHGGGAHNWGNNKSQGELVAEATEEPKVATEGEDATTEEEAEKEVEEVQMSLEEFQAQQKAARSGSNFETREVRVIENEFNSATQVKKEGKTEDFMGAMYEKVNRERNNGRKKNVFEDVGFRAAQPENNRREYNNDKRGGRGGRGGRGASRGGRGGSAPRGFRAPNVDDMSAFPTLG